MIDLQREYDGCWEFFHRQYPYLERPKLYIKKLIKTWGLCAKRYISLNRKLQKLDDVYFVRHVIYHEMSHLIHMNHSRAFYDVLKQFDPLLKKENEKLHKRVEAFSAIVEWKKLTENDSDIKTNC